MRTLQYRNVPLVLRVLDQSQSGVRLTRHLLSRSVTKLFSIQKDRSSGLPLMQVFCVVDNEKPGFAPLPLPLAWVTPKRRLVYCKILVFQKCFLNIKKKKKRSFDRN